LPAESDAKAVVASRKIGKATQRNRAKRLMRIALAQVFSSGRNQAARLSERFPPTRTKGVTCQDRAHGIWIVAIAREPILNAKSADVCHEVQQLLQLPQSCDRALS
jgi:RNase P protein component